MHLTETGHTQSKEKKKSYRPFSISQPQKLILKLDTENMPEHIQLIYNAAARFDPILSKIQSVGADEFSQFIPDKMLQFSLWAISERERSANVSEQVIHHDQQITQPISSDDSPAKETSYSLRIHQNICINAIPLSVVYSLEASLQVSRKCGCQTGNISNDLLLRLEVKVGAN